MGNIYEEGNPECHDRRSSVSQQDSSIPTIVQSGFTDTVGDRKLMGVHSTESKKAMGDSKTGC